MAEAEAVGSVSGTLDIAPPPKAGDKLRLQSLLLPTGDDGTYDFAHDDTGMLLSVCSMIDGSVQAFGTGFMVSPGAAMTAAHVVAEYEQAGRLHKGPLLFIGVYAGKLRAWSASRIHMPVKGDVALVEVVPRFDPAEEAIVNFVTLSARLPQAGEPVVALGLIAEAEDFPFDPEGGEGAHIVVTGLRAAGNVEAFYPERGQLLPGPTLQCNFKAPGGMSGGPVFDAKGHVIGIVSPSMALEGDVWVSWVSIHWPALFIEAHPEWPLNFHKQPACLWPSQEIVEVWRLGLGADGEIAYFGED